MRTRLILSRLRYIENTARWAFRLLLCLFGGAHQRDPDNRLQFGNHGVALPRRRSEIRCSDDNPSQQIALFQRPVRRQQIVHELRRLPCEGGQPCVG